MFAINIATSQMPLSSSMMTGSIEEMRDKKPEEMAQQFESLFVSMLVKEMRQSSSLGEGLFPGDSSDTYGGIFDMFMGQHLAEGGGIGLAKQIQESLN